MKMLRAIEFLVPRRPDTGAVPDLRDLAVAPTDLRQPAVLGFAAGSFNLVRDADPDTVPSLAISIGNRPRRPLVPWDATQCMGRSSWIRWLPCGDSQQLPP
jgi:hypothetical protein